MANKCNNKVRFFGTDENLKLVSNLFEQMISKQSINGSGQMPDFIESKYGVFFEIFVEVEQEYFYNYETRWSPNTEILCLIANHFDVGFESEYEEYGCKIFGKSVYKDQNLEDLRLSLNDFNAISYNEESDKFEFEGNEYGDDYEIVKILLDRKLSNNNLIKK